MAALRGFGDPARLHGVRCRMLAFISVFSNDDREMSDEARQVAGKIEAVLEG